MTVFDARGSVLLAPGGRYEYLGSARPSVGRWRSLGPVATVAFTGGHLDGGEATPMVQRPGRFYLTAPRVDGRWTCSARR